MATLSACFVRQIQIFWRDSGVYSDILAGMKKPQIIHFLRKKKDQVKMKFIQGNHNLSTRPT